MRKTTFSVSKERSGAAGPRCYDVWLTLPDQRRIVGYAWRHLTYHWRVRFYGPDGAAHTVAARRLNTLRALVKKTWNE